MPCYQEGTPFADPPDMKCNFEGLISGISPPHCTIQNISRGDNWENFVPAEAKDTNALTDYNMRTGTDRLQHENRSLSIFTEEQKARVITSHLSIKVFNWLFIHS